MRPARAATKWSLCDVTRVDADLLLVTERRVRKRNQARALQRPRTRADRVFGGSASRNGAATSSPALMASLQDELLVVASGGVVIRLAVRGDRRPGS